MVDGTPGAIVAALKTDRHRYNNHGEDKEADNKPNCGAATGEVTRDEVITHGDDCNDEIG